MSLVLNAAFPNLLGDGLSRYRSSWLRARGRCAVELIVKRRF